MEYFIIAILKYPKGYRELLFSFLVFKQSTKHKLFIAPFLHFLPTSCILTT